jgi:hypothetical protein
MASSVLDPYLGLLVPPPPVVPIPVAGVVAGAVDVVSATVQSQTQLLHVSRLVVVGVVGL